MEKIKKNFPIVLLWISLTSTAPFIFYSWPYHPYKVLTFICLFLMVVQILMKPNFKILDTRILLIIMIQLAYFLFTTLYHNDETNINHFIQLLSLIIIVLYIRGFVGFKLFAKSYILIILLMAIGGTITFFVHLFVGIDPIFSVNYSASGTSYFLGLTTSNVYFNVYSLRLIRYSGFFDEPGTFALYSLFAIILNRVYFKNTRVELWIIFLTIFTMSLAFYFAMIFYFMFFYFRKSNLKYFVILFLFIGAAFYYISVNKEIGTYSKLYEFTFKRFEVNEKGLAGDNRLDRGELDKEIFFKYPILGSGQTNEQITGANFYSIFAQYGIIGSLFYHSFVIYLFIIIIRLKGSDRFLFLRIFFLIILNFYTRPEMSSVFIMLFFVSVIIYIHDDLKPKELV